MGQAQEPSRRRRFTPSGLSQAPWLLNLREDLPVEASLLSQADVPEKYLEHHP